MLGIVKAASGRRAEAIVLLERALTLPEWMGRYGDAHFFLAGELDRAGRGEEALEHYREAVRLEPGSVPRRLALATALWARGRLDEAAEAFRACVEREGGTGARARARLSRGQILRALGRNPEAVGEFRSAAAEDPGLVDAWFNLAVSLVEQGSLEEALVAYREVLRVAPGDLATLLNLAEILFQTRHREEAGSRFAEVEALVPGSAEAFFARGRQHEISGDRAGALLAYREAAGAPPAVPGFRDSLQRLLGKEP
jgi:tetratricopeptide (TPR) repeat protein